MKEAQYEKAEKKVKKILNPLLNTPEWDVMLDMLNRRYMIKLLADRRKELGMTQAELAEKMGISQNSVSEFENSPWPDVRLTTYRRYCHALELTYTWELMEILEEPDHGDE